MMGSEGNDMGLMADVVLNLFSILILAVLFVYASSDGGSHSRQRRLYLLQLLSAIALLLFDAMGRFDGLENPVFPAINKTGNFLLFLFAPLLPALWFEYVCGLTHSEKGNFNLARKLMIALNAVNIIMTVATPFTGWYYAIDNTNTYHRGPFYMVSSLIAIALPAWAFVLTFLNRRKLDRRVLKSLLFFPFPSFLGIVLQTFIYGFPFALVGAVPSLLVVLLYAQDDSIYTDHLTGVGNRKKLETVLNEKVARSSRSRTFSFIMLDVDEFKKINDSLGHESGDRMLKAAAELLKKCVRANDYVTRYGGDEFCLILDVSTEPGLTRVVDRIGNALHALNQSGSLPAKLSFSMGIAIYPFDERPTAEAFLKRVDLLMYVDKRRKGGLDQSPGSDLSTKK